MEDGILLKTIGWQVAMKIIKEPNIQNMAAAAAGKKKEQNSGWSKNRLSKYNASFMSGSKWGNRNVLQTENNALYANMWKNFKTKLTKHQHHHHPLIKNLNNLKWMI